MPTHYKKQVALQENILKNFLIICALVLSWNSIDTYLQGLAPVHYDSLLIISTLLIMALLFANYSYTYEGTHITTKRGRFLGHAITFIVMYGIGIFLIITMRAFFYKTNSQFLILEIVTALFYISLILYDFWDLRKK